MSLKERIKRELQRLALENGGSVTPAQVVESAADPDSPLHWQFDWEDSEAATKWRLHQARNLILRLQIEVVAGSGETVRAFVSLTTDRKSGAGYRGIDDVLADREAHAQMLDDALAELRVFRRKYTALKALATVFAAIDEIERGDTKPVANQATA